MGSNKDRLMKIFGKLRYLAGVPTLEAPAKAEEMGRARNSCGRETSDCISR